MEKTKIYDEPVVKLETESMEFYCPVRVITSITMRRYGEFIVTVDQSLFPTPPDEELTIDVGNIHAVYYSRRNLLTYRVWRAAIKIRKVREWLESFLS